MPPLSLPLGYSTRELVRCSLVKGVRGEGVLRLSLWDLLGCAW